MCTEDARGLVISVLEHECSSTEVILVGAVTNCYCSTVDDGLCDSGAIVRAIEGSYRPDVVRMDEV